VILFSVNEKVLVLVLGLLGDHVGMGCRQKTTAHFI